MTSGALFVAVFLACAVEAIEALTIVLAVGTVRNWRSAGIGVVSGLVVLAVLVAALGPALTVIPLGALRLVVGGLLLVFEKEVAAARSAVAQARRGHRLVRLTRCRSRACCWTVLKSCSSR